MRSSTSSSTLAVMLFTRLCRSLIAQEMVPNSDPVQPPDDPEGLCSCASRLVAKVSVFWTPMMTPSEFD